MGGVEAMARKSLFKDDIIHARAEAMTVGPNTTSKPRRAAFGSEGLWAGVNTMIARDAASQWHHHADHDGVM